MRTKEQLKAEVEEFLLKGKVFEYILKSNPSVYEDKLKLFFNEDEITHQYDALEGVYFDYEPSSIKFIGNPIIYKFYDNDTDKGNYQNEAIYISDFEFNGFICKINSVRIELKIEATLRIFIRTLILPPVNGWIIIPDIIDVKDKGSFTIWDRKDKQNELQKLQGQLQIKFT